MQNNNSKAADSITGKPETKIISAKPRKWRCLLTRESESVNEELWINQSNCNCKAADSMSITGKTWAPPLEMAKSRKWKCLLTRESESESKEAICTTIIAKPLIPSLAILSASSHNFFYGSIQKVKVSVEERIRKWKWIIRTIIANPMFQFLTNLSASAS